MEYVVKFSVLIIFVVIQFADGFTYQQRMIRQTEICGYHNGHRKYLELGESGKLTANNITVPSVRTNFIDFQLPNWIISIDFRHKSFKEALTLNEENFR